MDTAIIKEAPSGLSVMRNGEEKLLVVGDKLQWGDELLNKSGHEVSVMIPAQSEGQTSTILTMAPEAQAQLVQKDTPLDDGAPRTEVLAMTDGVELYDVDVSTEVMGLVGTGGGGLGLLGGAGLLAGGLLAGALLNDDDDNNTTTTIQGNDSGDVNSDGVDDVKNAQVLSSSGNTDGDNLSDFFDTDDDNDGVYDDGIDPNDIDGDGVPNELDADKDGDDLIDTEDRDADNNGIYDDQEGGGDNGGGDPNGDPTAPTGGDVAGVTGTLLEVSEGLNSTPLAPLSAVTDGVASVTGMLGDGAAGFEGQDPSGTVAPLLSNTLGQPDPDFNANESSGVSGGIDSLSEGANTGIQAGALAPVSEQLTDPVLGEVAGGAAGIDDAAGTGGSTGTEQPANGDSPIPGLDPSAITSLPGVSELPLDQLPM